MGPRALDSAKPFSTQNVFCPGLWLPMWSFLSLDAAAVEQIDAQPLRFGMEALKDVERAW